MPSNYPDGMRESDIPGYWDTDCHCGGDDQSCELCDGSGVCDSRDLDAYHADQYDPDPPEPDEPWWIDAPEMR